MSMFKAKNSSKTYKNKFIIQKNSHMNVTQLVINKKVINKKD